MRRESHVRFDGSGRGQFPPATLLYRSELYSLAMRINEHLVRWAMQKFKRLRGQPTKAWAWLDAVRQHEPRLSPTGTCFHAPAADLWGPDEARVSRPVLREREGATPSRHSPEPHVRIDRGGWQSHNHGEAEQAPIRETDGTEPARPTGDGRASRLPHQVVRRAW